MKRWFKRFSMSCDVPFMGHSSEKWMPWVMGLMIFLSTLCALIFVESWVMARHWQQDLKGRWTIELTPSKAKESSAAPSSHAGILDADAMAFEAFKKQALKIILSDPGVARAYVMERPQLIKTLEPWLGAGNLLDDLPLPLFVDVACSDTQPLDVETLRQDLSEISDSITIQDHEVWYRPLVQVMRLIQGLSVGLGIVVFAASAAITMIVMSMNVSVHKDVVHTLQLIGAQDTYVVKQFQQHAHRMTLKAWAIGVLPSAESLILFQWALRALKDHTALPFSSSAFLWLVVLGIPLLFCGLISLTTRYTVLKALCRAPS